MSLNTYRGKGKSWKCDMDDIEELKIYVRQLEEENLRLKNSIKALRKNNIGMLNGIKKLQSYVHELKTALEVK